jgi:Cys-tRNA(Pro)/Cys-tRNA(Cys) deacylase
MSAYGGFANRQYGFLTKGKPLPMEVSFIVYKIRIKQEIGETDKMGQTKTNAMRLLDAQNISYEAITYDNKDGNIDGISVAQKIGKDVSIVYKTLVAQGSHRQLYVFVLPAAKELDLKKAAKAAKEKKIEMLPVKEIQKWTGYVRGGCSPVGMKKLYPTFLDESALSLEKIVVSGGKIGLQIELKTEDLKGVTSSLVMDIIKE